MTNQYNTTQIGRKKNKLHIIQNIFCISGFAMPSAVINRPINWLQIKCTKRQFIFIQEDFNVIQQKQLELI